MGNETEWGELSFLSFEYTGVKMPSLGLVINWCHTGDEPHYLPEKMISWNLMDYETKTQDFCDLLRLGDHFFVILSTEG